MNNDLDCLLLADRPVLDSIPLVEIERVVESSFPLTEIQRAYLLGRDPAIEYGGVSCHGYIELSAKAFDHRRLVMAFRRLIERHEMMRAMILSDGSQRILQEVPRFEIRTYDLRQSSKELAEDELLAIRNRMSHQILPTDAWPMFEICRTLCRDGTERLHLSMDLLIADLQSVSILCSELVELYLEPDLKLPPIEASFRDFVLQDASIVNTERYKRDQDYWMQRLPALPLGPELPLIPGAAKHNLRFERRSHVLAAAKWQRIKDQARQRRISASGVLLAVYAQTVAAWTQTRHFLLNVTLSNRRTSDPRWANVVGDFTGVNLLEVSAPYGESFTTFALRLRDQLRRDLSHRHFSGLSVMRALGRERGSSAPIAPVVFSSNVGRSDASLSNPIEQLGQKVSGISQTPQVWIDHQIYEFNNALEFNWDFADSVFPTGLVDDMFQAYCASLDRLAENINCWDQEFVIDLPPGQRLRRSESNATNDATSPDLLQSRFRKHAKAHADAPAVISGARVLSYGEISKRAGFVGAQVQALGGSCNKLVAVIMEKGWEQVVGVLGILNAGAAYVPLDPKWPAERLLRLLDDAEVEIVLTQSWLSSTLAFGNRKIVCVDQFTPTQDYEACWEERQSPNDLAYVIYTSGSTGTPKGVAIDHQSAVNTINDINSRFNIGSQDRVFAISSLTFDLSVYDIFGILAAGGAVVIPDDDKLRDPEHWLNLIENHGVTVWNSVPALMQMSAEAVPSRGTLLSSLRLALLSGDWIPLQLPGLIRAAAPNAKLISLGGATEVSIWSISYPIEGIDPQWTSVPYGRPLKNQRFYVLDSGLHDCPDWVTGELYIGGKGLALGYWRDEAKTREKFIVHPRTNERLYRTGDLGRMLPDGNIEFQGRNDFQVKIHGYRIELGEIESALSECRGVRRAVVGATEVAGSKRLIAYLVLDDTVEEPSCDDFSTTLKGRLPEYMIPAEFVVVDKLPLTSNGKLDWCALHAKKISSNCMEPRKATPGNPIETRLARMWAEVLGLNVEQVDTRRSFFHMGGDSLLLLRLLRMIKQEFGIHLDVRDLFVNPTIEYWANLIFGTVPVSNRISLVPLHEGGTRPPLFWIPAADGNVLIFKKVVDLLGGEQPSYGFQFVGSAEDEESAISIEQTAQRNVETLRKVQPHGPYHLAGYCWGCTLVWEMARQLISDGEQIAHLILIDPLHPDYYGYFLDNPVLLIGLMAQVINPSREVDLMSIETLQGLTIDEQITRAHAHLQRMNLVVPELSLKSFRAMLLHFKNNLQTLVDYRAQDYDGPVTLFIVEDYPPEWLAYWQKRARGLEVVNLSGTHYSIWVNALHAQNFSEHLQGLLHTELPEPSTMECDCRLSNIQGVRL